ncbi:N-acetyltransferase family protein [Streptomyces sp. URMC 123]|uniref:GNAT family N-acetyltransferase n=1 Tax=Streptomyces sp. URMC 123 TaxID=3423403 RepID=UPI003F1AB622
MGLTFDVDPDITPRLRDEVCELWLDVSNAGGAVGFVPPVTMDEIRPEFVRQLVALVEGRSRLIVGRDGADGPVVATAFLSSNSHRLMRHWCWVFTVMVHPSLQGRGHGRELMAAVEEAARGTEGLRGLRLGVRGGMGTERFYASCGYKEVGRVPDAIKVAEDDYRDDITMYLPLD